ncbi:MAG: tRNA (adenosine(37)-N6)-threonylcarbamoyltransferase complex dimerization subunit type 1 TsaB [Aminivibrio sp.]
MSARILSVDCTNMRWTTLGLSEGGRSRGEFNAELGKSQAALLPGLVESFLGAFGLTVRDMDFFAAVTGPGSFTGIKAGMAFVQFLAWGLGKKVIPLSSLEVIAFGHGLTPGSLVCPLLSAGGGRAYSALYRAGEEGEPPAEVFPEGVYAGAELATAVLSHGVGGVQRFADFPERLGSFFPASSPSLRRIRPSGSATALLAYLYTDRAVYPADLEPVYFKDPDVGR